MAHHGPLVLVFGLLGNMASFLCFLAPVPTFYRVYKKKTTEGFQSLPYIAALFSAMLWLFYAYVKTGETLLITINAFGCVIETIYLAIYITYCPKKARMSTLRLILLMNFAGFCVIVLLTHLLAKGPAARVKLLGWICVVFATSVFAAPLSIIRVVIRTKSVEFLPFPLSLLLTISAVMWLMYGLALKDIYVTLPNVVGLSFGIVQMVLYAMYRKNKPVKDEKLPEQKGEVMSENKQEATNENKNVGEEEKHEMVTIEIGEHQKKDEEEKLQEKEQIEQEQPHNKQDQTKVNDVDDKARPAVEPSFIEIPPQQMVACEV
ncbi:bidirectional sugar transporter N3-like [Neltuma alba]|uniref:bidirectional sugar transporter N3-like n=1 Tax=Neltuma alba TaxID=207710 RepID=UPI0010A33426|nr:bidirectional sugar transporter N3-like [Prosopis alba]XP_028765208.1 bidirectional sugar transporter N3-like [Prosopis alba]XP_028765209.1 bidirectional sugar transporter N3-like [Prosopis alba]